MEHSAPTPPFTPVLVEFSQQRHPRDYSICRLGDDGTTWFLREIYRNNFPSVRNFPTDEELDKKTLELMYRAKECERYHKYREKTNDDKPVPNIKTEKKWPDYLEYGFFKSLLIYPPVGRKAVNCPTGKARRGRNELIASALEIWTGETCGRKQVSSHLQVLKPKVANDPEILMLLGDSKSRSKKKAYRMSHQANLLPDSPASPVSSFAFPYLRSRNQAASYPVSPTMPSHFVMYIHSSRTKEKFHTLTVLSRSPERSALSIPSSGSLSPRLSSLFATLSPQMPNCPIILCEASLSPTIVGFPSGSELGIELNVALGHINAPRRNTRVECQTTFWYQGMSVENIEKEVEYSDRNHSILNIPLGSNFWATKVRGLRPGRIQGQDFDVNGLSAVQIVSTVDCGMIYSKSLPKEPIFVLLWQFKLGIGGFPGHTTWRPVIHGTPKVQADWFSRDGDIDDGSSSDLMDFESNDPSQHLPVLIGNNDSTASTNLTSFAKTGNEVHHNILSNSFPTYMPLYSDYSNTLPINMGHHFTHLPQSGSPEFSEQQQQQQQQNQSSRSFPGFNHTLSLISDNTGLNEPPYSQQTEPNHKLHSQIDTQDHVHLDFGSMSRISTEQYRDSPNILPCVDTNSGAVAIIFDENNMSRMAMSSNFLASHSPFDQPSDFYNGQSSETQPQGLESQGNPNQHIPQSQNTQQQDEFAAQAQAQILITQPEQQHMYAPTATATGSSIIAALESTAESYSSSQASEDHPSDQTYGSLHGHRRGHDTQEVHIARDIQNLQNIQQMKDMQEMQNIQDMQEMQKTQDPVRPTSTYQHQEQDFRSQYPSSTSTSRPEPSVCTVPLLSNAPSIGSPHLTPLTKTLLQHLQQQQQQQQQQQHTQTSARIHIPSRPQSHVSHASQVSHISHGSQSSQDAQKPAPQHQLAPTHSSHPTHPPHRLTQTSPQPTAQSQQPHAHAHARSHPHSRSFSSSESPVSSSRAILTGAPGAANAFARLGATEALQRALGLAVGGGVVAEEEG